MMNCLNHTMIFNIHFLPARYGDCIWLEYGTTDKLHHILIDGGTAGTKRDIKQMLAGLPAHTVFDLLVVTHIDRDHIEGILSILEEDELSIQISDIWFNGWGHLPEDEMKRGLAQNRVKGFQPPFSNTKFPGMTLLMVRRLWFRMKLIAGYLIAKWYEADVAVSDDCRTQKITG